MAKKVVSCDCVHQVVVATRATYLPTYLLPTYLTYDELITPKESEVQGGVMSNNKYPHYLTTKLVLPSS